MKEGRFDLIIIGAGSGGIGVAIAAGRLGLKVLLLEKNSRLGGNAAVSGVSVWEMGVGGTGIPFDIYRRMKKERDAIGIYSFNRHCAWKNENGTSQFPPGADLTIDPTLRYLDSLRRFGARSLKEDELFVRKHWHGVPFEPGIYQNIVKKWLDQMPDVTVRTSETYSDVAYSNSRIEELTLTNGEKVSAPFYIDSTDSAYLVQSCGREMLFGQESRHRFDEPGAPETPSRFVNGVSLIFRIRPTERRRVEELPGGIGKDCWWRDAFPLASMVQYPNGDYNVNMLPTMDGQEYMEWDPKTVYQECKNRSLAYWHYLQTEFPEFQSYKRVGEFLSLGVRETHRIVAEYILTELDVTTGLNGQKHPDIIAIADHPMDVHGGDNPGCRELSSPYGIPFRCLIPEGMENVLVASRAGGFSSIAASSCRLSRTMMQLGQAAGTAAYVALDSGRSFQDLDIPKLQDLLEDQHVQLSWPMPGRIRKHIGKERCDSE